MANWLPTINDLASAWASNATRACWQGGLMIGAVWVLCRVWRRITPAAKCWLWRLAFLKLLVALVWVTPVRLPILPPVQTSGISTSVGVTVGGPGPLDLAGRVDGSEVVWPTGMPDSEAPGLSATSWVFAAWFLGAVLCAGHLVFERRYVRRLRGASLPLGDHRLENWVTRACGRLGLDRVPQLRTSDTASSPMLLGVRRPVIVLPSRLVEECSPGELRVAVAHELAHVKRRDLVWNWLPALGHLFFYLHPAVWLARRDWRRWQETACDEAAISISRGSAAELGSVLLKVALGRRASPSVTLGLAEMRGSRSQIEWRLRAMRRDDRHGRRSLVAAIVLTAAVGVFGVVPWEVTAQEANEAVPAEAAGQGGETGAGEGRRSSAVEVRLPSPAPGKPTELPAPVPRPMTLREFLERTAKSPLGLGEAGLLRAVAELIEKEQSALGSSSAGEPHNPLASSRRYRAPVRPAPAERTQPAPTDPRNSMVFRLKHTPAADVAEALEELLSGEREAGRSRAGEVVLVTEPISNCVLVSGTPEVMDRLTRIVEQLDIAPGVGLRITVPAMGPAPVALDFAFPISNEGGDEIENFSFFVSF